MCICVSLVSVSVIPLLYLIGEVNEILKAVLPLYLYRGCTAGPTLPGFCQHTLYLAECRMKCLQRFSHVLAGAECEVAHIEERRVQVQWAGLDQQCSKNCNLDLPQVSVHSSSLCLHLPELRPHLLNSVMQRCQFVQRGAPGK